MVEKNNEDLEKVPVPEEIAYHKGCVNTLLKEREGLAQMIQIVDGTLKGHFKRLKELGLDFEEPKLN
jgi:hypothetical protein